MDTRWKRSSSKNSSSLLLPRVSSLRSWTKFDSRSKNRKKKEEEKELTYTGAGGEIKTWRGKWRWYKGEVIIRGRKVGYFIRCPEAIVVKIVRCKRIPPPLARRDFTSRTDVPPPPRDNRSHTTSVRGCKPFHRANLAPSTTVICHSNGQNEGQRGF